MSLAEFVPNPAPDQQSEAAAGASPTQAVRVQLLVSIRNAKEARLARNAGVDWIDLKEPDAGPLGAADPDVAAEVGQILADYPRRSAALGEIGQLREECALRMAQLFPTLKVGFSGLGQDSQWKNRIRALSKRLSAASAELVPVIYADWRNCDAPSPDDLTELSLELGAKHVLIDTYGKTEGNVFSWMSTSQVEAIAHRLNRQDCGVVLAGSLHYELLDKVVGMPLSAVGVRGAVCNGNRADSICPEKLQTWVARLNSL